MAAADSRSSGRPDESFLVIRLSSLGDIIHTLPAFAALRKAFPGTRIAWLVEKAGKDILDLVPRIDEIIVVRSKGWLRRLRDRNRTALDFQGLLKSAAAARLSGARRRIGFAKANLREPAAGVFYTEQAREADENRHVIARNLGLLENLGIIAGGWEFPIEIPPNLRAGVVGKIKELGFSPPSRIVIINVGAAWETKRWTADKWASVLNGLKTPNIFPLILWGTDIERGIARDLAAKTGAVPAPFMSIPEVLALIEQSDLLLSGDTFALQAACALGTPVVGIFGPTNPARNGPFGPRDKTLHLPIPCHPCYKRECSRLECLSRLDPDRVAEQAEKVLKDNDGSSNR